MVTFVLYHQRGHHAGNEQRFSLDEGDEIVLGRRPELDIVFHAVHDIKASGRHARIFVRDATLFIEDLGSSNGTYLNEGDELAAPHPLSHRDLIELGAGGPKLLIDIESTPEAMAVEDTIVEGEAPAPPPKPKLLPEPALPSIIDRNITSPGTPRPRVSTGDDLPNTHDGEAQAEPSPEPPIPETVEASPEKAKPRRSIIGATTVALMIKRAQAQTSRRFITLIIALAILLIVAIGAILYLVVKTQDTEEAIHEQARNLSAQQLALDEQKNQVEQAEQRIARKVADFRAEQDRVSSNLKQAQLAMDRKQQALSVEVTEQLRSEFQTSQQELVDSLNSVEASLSKAYGPALYMLIAAPDESVLFPRLEAARAPLPKPGAQEGFCTAFAITPDGYLATNAHCIDAMYALLLDYAESGIPVSLVAKRHEDSSTAIPLRIETARRHRRHTHVYSPDVAVIQMDLAAAGLASVPAYVQLATPEELAAVAPGQPIYTLGFPGKVMDAYRVLADFRGGNIARLTPFDTASDSPTDKHWVWHTALISKGTSGSPIFDREGHVVAVNSGTESVEQVLTSDGSSQSVKYIYSADALNFGVRVDLLHEVINDAGITLPTRTPAQETPP